MANGQQQNGTVPNGSSSSNAASSSQRNQLQPLQGQQQAMAMPPQPPLADFLMQLEDYSPTIPDAVTKYYLSTAGFDTSDPRVLRLVSLATQKFISDIANDALQHCKMRGGSGVPASTTGGANAKGGKNIKDRKYVMTTDDLANAMADQGITVKKPPYFMWINRYNQRNQLDIFAKFK